MAGVQRVDDNACRCDGSVDDLDERSNAATSNGAERPRQAEFNGQRTSGRAVASYAEAGETGSSDSWYAGFALLKGRDNDHPVDIEVLTVSGQIGGQMEVQLGEARLGLSFEEGSSVGLELFTARAGVGTRNVDGSFGFNAGATAVAAGVEGTLSLGSASSVTAGASFGVGAEASFGLRDMDHDQRPEVCARAVAAWWTLGACAELPFEAPALKLPGSP